MGEIRYGAHRQSGCDRQKIVDAEIAKRDALHKAETIAQVKSILTRTPELDPTDLKNYPLVRARLMRDNPLGAMSDEAQKALEQFDKSYESAVALENQYKKADENSRLAEGRADLKTIRKMAEDMGPEATAAYFSDLETGGPDAAIKGVTERSGDTQAGQFDCADAAGWNEPGGNRGCSRWRHDRTTCHLPSCRGGTQAEDDSRAGT